METNEQVTVKPVPELNFFMKMMSKLPKNCSYCGKRYVPCHSNNVNVFFPLAQNGKCCPDGHEGFVKVFHGWGYVNNWFDFVKNPPETVEVTP